MNHIKDQKGLSLIEMIFAVSIFSVAFMLASSIFQNVLEGQRSAISAQNIQESTSYAFEMMSKEIRHAQKMISSAECGALGNFIGGNEIYNGSADDLYFKNRHNQCVRYYFSGDRLRIARCVPNDCEDTETDLPVSPDEVKVSNLNFVVIDNIWNQSGLTVVQPKVTFSMDIEMAGGKAIHKQAMKMQTTVSSRYYE